MILLIDNYDSFTYNLYQLMSDIGAEVIVKRNDSLSIDNIKALNPAGIVISPGPGRPENAGICIEIIKQFSGKCPLLGICLGHQAMAIAFGGHVTQATEIMHGKTSATTHNQDALFTDIPNPFQAGRYHSLIVEPNTLPKTLIITAQTNNNTIMAMRHQSHPSFGLQFHPESILTPHGQQLLKNFVHLCKTREAQ